MIKRGDRQNCSKEQNGTLKFKYVISDESALMNFSFQWLTSLSIHKQLTKIQLIFELLLYVESQTSFKPCSSWHIKEIA